MNRAPYQTYINQTLAAIERRLAPYPSWGNDDGDEVYRELCQAVAPVDPSAFRATVAPLLSLCAIGVEDDTSPLSVAARIEQALQLAAER
jgi:hypothetical protein